MNSQEILNFLTEVEKHGNRNFRYKNELSWLMKVANERSMERVFDDILFFSKFLANSIIVMKREGPDSEATQKLNTEFKATLEKYHTLLRTLVKDSGEPERSEFVNKFLLLTPDCMSQILALAGEMTWIKNYYLDHQQL